MGKRIKTVVGARIKEVRMRSKMTQAELAERTNLSVPYISHIEHGRKIPSVPALVNIANVLGVTSDALMYGVQDNDKTTYQTDMDELLDQCRNSEERKILYISAKFVLKIMRMKTSQVKNSSDRKC